VPEGRQLFPSLTVEENLRLGWEVGRRDGLSMSDLYAMFPILRERRRQRAGQLSGGQQQLVAFGRALLANPDLLLCDEISLGLAPKIVDEIYAELPRLKANGTAIIVVEQDLARALEVSDRFYCLLEGRVSLSGGRGEHSFEDVTRAYFGTGE
jgi:branched-chain amino acid transport system ATP-binding protein